MLERLVLHDFQKHERQVFDLEQITSFVGKSNSGKSCILRALKWIAVNRPAGSSLIRRGTERAKAILTIDGHKITRSRGKGGNNYSLDGKRYAAFGSGVPDPIAELLAVGPETFQGQHDAPFLFSLSPGQVAQSLNEIVDLGLIDTTLANLAAVLRKAKAAAEVGKERLAQAKEEKKRLSWVPDAVARYKKVNQLQDTAQECLLKHTRTVDLLKYRSNLLERLESSSRTVQGLAKVVARGEEAVTAADRWYRAKGLLQEREQLVRKQEQAEQEAKQLEERVAKILKERCPACGRGNQ